MPASPITRKTQRLFGRIPVLDWLQRSASNHPKHSSWLHPAVVCLLHYSIVASVSIAAHDWLLYLYVVFNDEELLRCNVDSLLQERRTRVATCLFCYSAWLLLWRLFVRKEPGRVSGTGVTRTATATPPRPPHTILYEYCWLCNVTLVVAAVALRTNRPALAAAYTVTVGIDQIMWYVDLLGYACTGQFVVGVAKYICWPGSNSDWTSRVTCTHHLWTIPLVLYGCGGAAAMHELAYPLSFVCMSINVLLSRFLTPYYVASDSQPRYMNVNLAHALWKDIKFEILQISDDDPPAPLYLFRLLWRWQGFNTIVFGLLYAACRAAAAGRPPTLC